MIFFVSNDLNFVDDFYVSSDIVFTDDFLC